VSAVREVIIRFAGERQLSAPVPDAKKKEKNLRSVLRGLDRMPRLSLSEPDLTLADPRCSTTLKNQIAETLLLALRHVRVTSRLVSARLALWGCCGLDRFWPHAENRLDRTTALHLSGRQRTSG